jgi:hypothetical protein
LSAFLKEKFVDSERALKMRREEMQVFVVFRFRNVLVHDNAHAAFVIVFEIRLRNFTMDDRFGIRNTFVGGKDTIEGFTFLRL